MRSIPVILALLLTLAAHPLAADGKNPAHMHATLGDLTIHHVWSRATPPTAKSGVVYLYIENSGTADDALVSASTPVANNAMVHETTVRDGVMKMSHVMDLAIPAGETVKLEPSGLHVMLTGLKSPLKAAASFKLTLTFEKAGDITIDVPVLLPGKTLEHSH